MQDRADKNNSRDRDSEDLSEKFTLEFTKEEGMLLLTSARLLDKLVAGVTIHARERDELIKEIIEKLADQVPQDVARVSGELADAIVDSVLGCDELDDDYAFADALAMNMPDSDPDADLTRIRTMVMTIAVCAAPSWMRVSTIPAILILS